MSTPVTADEILRYCELREAGLTVRQAAEQVGRSRTGLHRYDPYRQAKPRAPKLEDAIAVPIEEALDEAITGAGDQPALTASQIIDLHPTLRDRIRNLANLVAKLIGRVTGRTA